MDGLLLQLCDSSGPPRTPGLGAVAELHADDARRTTAMASNVWKKAWEKEAAEAYGTASARAWRRGHRGGGR